MKFLDDIMKKNEKKLPKKASEGDTNFVDWQVYTHPTFMPLVHFEEEFKSEDKKGFN